MSGTANNNVSGSFYNLLNQYNATSGTTGATTIVQLPLAFVRSGYMRLAYGYVYNTGYNGDYWSRTAYSAANTYALLMSPTYVNSYYYDRWYGFPLLCLYLASKSRDNLRHPYLSD